MKHFGFYAPKDFYLFGIPIIWLRGYFIKFIIETRGKRWRKPKEQSKMDNPGPLWTLGTQDKERREANHKTQHTSEN